MSTRESFERTSVILSRLDVILLAEDKTNSCVRFCGSRFNTERQKKRKLVGALCRVLDDRLGFASRGASQIKELTSVAITLIYPRRSVCFTVFSNA